ncbi:MAG: hypothetical protein WBA89_07765 [Microcoleus sp.]|uniref:hypothetical protein n=1 Tax=unclassified Microcoleus TaxID=2642155 RepID=UPI000D072C21|nr:hypothetical protein C7B69_04805 [filamentous cyanobacterium Phorm 46]PSB53504.1 hypothetical protein C7B67_02895 [filamentous cyanobacterium Phorm 6]
MLRALIAIFVAFAITFVGTAKPAYAYSDDFSMTSIPPIEIQANGGSSHISDFSNTRTYEKDIEQSNNFIGKVIEGTGEGVKIIATMITISGFCYVASAAATTVFPPAAALVVPCTALGAVGAEAKTMLKGFDRVLGAH